MRSRRSGKTIWLSAAAGLIMLTGLFVVYVTQPLNRPSNTNSSTNSNRLRYAALYDAAWRQDDGTDATLVTATLLLPPTVTALGADSGRSPTEEQLWTVVQSLDNRSVPIVVTLDSVSGTVTDEAIQKSLSLSSNDLTTFTLSEWKPLIAPTRIVNTSAGASSQIGVATFTPSSTIDWQKIGVLQLTVKGIGGQATRLFTWTEPRLLLEL